MDLRHATQKNVFFSNSELQEPINGNILKKFSTKTSKVLLTLGCRGFVAFKICSCLKTGVSYWHFREKFTETFRTLYFAKYIRIVDYLVYLCTYFEELLFRVTHFVKYARIRVSLTRVFSYKGRFYDYVLIRKDAGQRKPVFWHILSSTLYSK